MCYVWKPDRISKHWRDNMQQYAYKHNICKATLVEDGLSHSKTQVRLNLHVLDGRFEYVQLKVISGCIRKFIPQHPPGSLKDPFQAELERWRRCCIEYF